jgi:hypothetical protein
MPRKRVVQTSGPAPKTKHALPIADPADLAKRFAGFPAIDVLSRRFSDPSDPGSLPILLKDEPAHACVNTDHQNRMKPGATVCQFCKKPVRQWYVRWFNLGIDGRNAQMRQKGYVGVEIVELQDADDVADLYRSEKDRYVRRGDRGLELLAKMPLEAFLYIKGQQRAAWNQQALSKKKLRSDLANAAGRDLGDEAGQSIHDGDIQIESMTRRRATLGDEADLEEVGVD